MKTNLLYLRLLEYAKPHWKLFLLTLFCMMIFALTEPAMPALMKPLLDGSFVNKDPKMISLMPLIIVIIFIIRGITNVISTVGMSWIAQKVVMELRQNVFDKVIRLPASHFDNQATGSIISKMTYDVVQVAQASTEVLVTIVKDSVTIMGLLGWMLYVNWKLSLIMLLVGPVIAIIVSFVSKRMRVLNRSLQDSMGNITHVLEEAINGYKVMKIFGGQPYETNRFADVNNWIRRYTMKTVTASAVSVSIVQLVTVSALATIIYFASMQSVSNEITVGGFVSFIGAMAMLFSPIKRLTSVNEKLQRGLAAAESIFNVIDLPSEADNGQQTLEQVKGDITFKDVTFTYNEKEKPALEQFNLTIKAGQTVALVGPSGSGKSTLANLLPLFYRPTSGQIEIDNINIESVTLESLRQQIAFVSQDIVLFNDTLKANIAYGSLTNATEEDVKQAADHAYALSFIDKLPEGIHSQIGEKGAQLSGGQRQRIAIARAFLKDAPILILDEATSALDTESEKYIQESLEQLKKGRTTIIIAHRLSTIETADCIVVLKDGQLAEHGSHQNLMKNNGLYAQLYNTQFSND